MLSWDAYNIQNVYIIHSMNTYKADQTWPSLHQLFSYFQKVTGRQAQWSVTEWRSLVWTCSTVCYNHHYKQALSTMPICHLSVGRIPTDMQPGNRCLVNDSLLSTDKWQNCKELWRAEQSTAASAKVKHHACLHWDIKLIWDPTECTQNVTGKTRPANTTSIH